MRLTSDHLGSTTYITDREGNPEQYLSYLPHGEVFIDKSFKDSYATPYKFNGDGKISTADIQVIINEMKK
ncbi:MAG: hypothetical protein IJL45_00235 [Prevotella sp.]|nr:hypothetical protein [Prevotella sp.]